MVDFRRNRPHLQPVSIDGVRVDMEQTYKYMGLELDDRLDCAFNTDALYRKGQSRLCSLRRLGSFNIRQMLLQMFYQKVINSILLYAVVCCGGSTEKRDKLARKAGSVVSVERESLTSVAEKRILS